MKATESPLTSQLFAAFSSANEIRSRGENDRTMEEILGEISGIRKKLAAPEVVAAAAKKLEGAKALLEKIKETIETKNAEMVQVNGQLPDMSPLFDKRTSLLADVELGIATATDLAALDEEIEAARERNCPEWQKGDKITEHIDQLIEGLQRKAECQAQEIEELTSELKEVSLQAILRIALDKAERYTKRAMETAQLYGEVLTLNKMLNAAHWGDHFNGLLGLPFEENALIPALNAPPFSGDRHPYGYFLLDVERMGIRNQPVCKRPPEIASLAEAGAIIPEIFIRFAE
ncbi:hypothetical protein D3870_21340 [Noviherbaspirillum cavernae]|uniref:Uncharacterized protein n=1 Tax=Noviherbaspirillum cavernae TaxID=2320862 RepID=A0A418WW44_9BURK|nr:hypothetical protein [Noviherbaspirillum cavernae]RJF96915.1 hypothetical protein D3870_21340 [Noviherbaspirillum cavernae]